MRAIRVVVGLLLLMGVASGKIRTWTDASGKYKVDADLVGQADGVLTLREASGKKKQIPLKSLSEVDKKFLKALADFDDYRVEIEDLRDLTTCDVIF